MPETTSGDREFDVVLFGATGYVGRLVAEHLAEHAPEGTRIALAGRSAARLGALRAEVGTPAAGWPLLVADAQQAESVARLARAARVVATTVGPYARYGLPLVEACARTGTDYVDLTGELLFVRTTIDRCHATAVASGARLVHSCGFDSVPSDLGVLVTYDRAHRDAAGQLEDTTLVVTDVKGGVSGGTIDSLRTQLAAVRADPRLRHLLDDPYALSPDRSHEPDLGDETDRTAVERIGNEWAAPFVMAPYNTRVVRRSNALRTWAYGRRFCYREVMSFGSRPSGAVMAAGTAAATVAFLAAMNVAPTRALLDRVLPAPGHGPAADTRRTGRFRMEIRTRTSTDAGYRTVVAAHRDPGYGATSVMLGESALCLALDRDRLPESAGVLTPATGIGLPLVDRLRGTGFELSAHFVT
ncbi:MAG TPA: saccharopine dehydrogenase NADP-binding domain-containing protein [Mycobacteriales bacterium]|nr:saccharopine dehydrogenase NADP-binding domain-containing protein [Mycobacteriales bacterium]